MKHRFDGLKALLGIAIWMTLLTSTSLAQDTSATGAATPTKVIVGGDELTILKGFQSTVPAQTFAILGEPFTHGLRLRVETKPANFWEASAKLLNDAPIEKGARLRVEFYARRADSKTEPAAVEFVLKESKPPYGKTQGEKQVGPINEWQKYDFSFISGEAFGAREAQFEFMLGFKAQTVEIADFKVTQVATGAVSTEKVPLTYPGREPDAAWRKEAAARIEKHRKGDLTVNVVDAQGKPIPGAQVDVAMKRHAFYFGTAVSVSNILGTREDDRIYRENLLELFNYATIDNNLKMDAWRAGEKDPAKREQTLKTVQWLSDNNLTQRGHTLVWWLQYGKWEIDMSREELIALMKDHVADMTGHPLLSKAILDWDVQNEASHNSPIYNKIGNDALVEIFKAARRHDPDGRLFINDAKITSQRIPKHAHHESFHYDLAKYLIEHGAPLDGIGFQGHHSGNNATDPQEVLRILNRFAALGKVMQITEFDIKTYNAEGAYSQEEIDRLEADYTRDYMTITFSHPLVDAFIMWGFWDGNHWKDNAPVFRRDWSLKLSGQAYKDLVFDQWWTRTSGQSNERGEYAMRGFLGDYEISVTHDGKTKTVKTSLPKAGQTVTVKFD